ncbi:glycosyltransferase family protein [Pasteurella testudinis]|uniref:glycosyltransferase family protein n=1 Tax=Pasteurella testudinis TaxID=761 RepID=UPI00405995B0
MAKKTSKNSKHIVEADANKQIVLDKLAEIAVKLESMQSVLTEKQETSTDGGNDVSARFDQLANLLEHNQTASLKRLEGLEKSKEREIELYTSKIKDLTEKVGKLENEKIAREKELKQTRLKIEQGKEQVRNTLSFKLGYMLIHSTKSLSAFCSLPVDLINLRKLAKARKLNKGVPKLAATTSIASYPKIDGRFKKQHQIKFISILDEISHVSFDSEFKFFPLNKASFEAQIKESTSLGFFIESCWKGNFGAWEYAFTSPNLQHQNAQNLLKALDTAKARKLPVIFWNKEDPMHYDKFLPISSKCDVIFTTDSNKVADYRRDVPHAKVEAMLFAANINICNPSGRFRNEAENICFAGSYYGEGHDDRKKQMDALLPTIIKYKGAIYDRMSQLENKRYAYPRKFRKFIRPAVPFREVVDIYKKFKIFLNVNTITDSPTMMSRRVYELLACGTPVISTPSLALEKQFPGIVQVAANAKEANAIAKRLLENEWEWLRLSHKGYREVMLNHTYEHRAIQIANVLGQNIQKTTPLASVVMASNRPHFIDRIVDNLCKQSYANMEIIIITQNYTEQQLSELNDKIAKSGKVFQNIYIVTNNSDDTLGKRLNQGIELSKGEYVAKFDDDDFYFPNYLQDMLIPFSFGNYGIVGKKEIFMYFEKENKTFVRYKGSRHTETDFLTGATLVFSREALKSLKFGDLNRGEDSNILEQAKKNKIRMYVTDPFNFVVFRAADLSNHTWQVDNNFFIERSVFVGHGLAEDVTKI